MFKKSPRRKLSVKKETLRKLDTLTSDQLQRVAGGGGEAIHATNFPTVTAGCVPRV